MEKKKLYMEMNQLFCSRSKFQMNAAGESGSRESTLLAERAHINFQLNRFNDALKDADLSLAAIENRDPYAHYVKAAALLELYENIREVVDHLKLFLASSPENANCNEARIYTEKAESKLQQCSINRLPDEMLIKIFQCLPFRERMRAEIVCRRWNSLVKSYGWSNFRYFVPHRYLPVTHYKSKYLPLFKRCAPYLYGLSLAQVGICPSLLDRLLPTLINLRHLNLDSMDLSSATLVSIAKALPNLKSVAFSDFDADASQGLQFFMKTCSKLELLCLHGENELFDFDFAVLPPSLKCLDVYSFVPYHNILRQAALQEIHLEALVVRNEDDSSTVHEATFHVSSLKYLQVDVYANSIHNFISALNGLPDLCALDLQVGEDVSYQMGYHLIEEIARKCKRLQHLSIRFFRTQYGEDLFDVVGEELMNIKSLTLMGAFEDNKLAYLFPSNVFPSNSVVRLLEKISLYKKLEHFHTDAFIPLESVFKTILRCEKLASFGSGNREDNVVEKIVEFLEFHEDGKIGLIKVSDMSRFSFAENPVRQRFRIGCLSAGKPTSFEIESTKRKSFAWEAWKPLNIEDDDLKVEKDGFKEANIMLANALKQLDEALNKVPPSDTLRKNWYRSRSSPSTHILTQSGLIYPANKLKKISEEKSQMSEYVTSVSSSGLQQDDNSNQCNQRQFRSFSPQLKKTNNRATTKTSTSLICGGMEQQQQQQDNVWQDEQVEDPKDVLNGNHVNVTEELRAKKDEDSHEKVTASSDASQHAIDMVNSEKGIWNWSANRCTVQDSGNVEDGMDSGADSSAFGAESPPSVHQSSSSSAKAPDVDVHRLIKAIEEEKLEVPDAGAKMKILKWLSFSSEVAPMGTL